MTHKDFMKQSLCKFQFTPTHEGTYAIDTNFNFYFIYTRGRDETSINKICATLEEVAVLSHSLPIMSFESEVLNKVVTLIHGSLHSKARKLEELLTILEE